MFGHKAWVDVGELHETAREQTRTAEKNKRKRDLDHNERSAQTTRAPPSVDPRAPCFKRFLHVGARGEQRRRDAKNHARSGH